MPNIGIAENCRDETLPTFDGKLGIQQRILPSYRTAFFDALAGRCTQAVEVFAGTPRKNEGINVTDHLRQAGRCFAKNIHITRGPTYLCWQKGLLGWLNQFQPDVLVVEANPRILSTYFALRIMKRWKRPVVGWGLGMLDWTGPSAVLKLRSTFLSHFFKSFDALIAYSTKGGDDYLKCGVNRERIHIAPNAVSDETARIFIQKVKDNPQMLATWKKKINLTGKPTVIYVGRLVAEKKLENLFFACAKVQPPCELLIVGEGPERPKLEKLATEIFSDAHFLGYQSGESLALSFLAADLFVLPGAGGLAIQEAMMYGKPVVVASGDGTQADLVLSGENGFNVPPNNIAALAQIIETCLNDPFTLRKMGENSRRIVEEHHNQSKMVRSFLLALDNVQKKKLSQAPLL